MNRQSNIQRIDIDPNKCAGCCICGCMAPSIFEYPQAPSVMPTIKLRMNWFEAELEDAVYSCPEEAISAVCDTHRLSASGESPIT